jgi:cobalt/nickel transport system permease protein
MHLPDGFLDARTALLSTGAAAAGVGLALRRVRASLEPRRVPLLGLAAAFVFAAQMVNFPVPGGTSGHLVGGVLLAVLLGLGEAVLVMTCVLLVQCLMFNDGGLLALGANVFNMGLANAGGGYLVFRLTRSLLRMEATRATVLAAAFAAWCGTVLAAVTCAGQLALSHQSSWAVAFPAMTLVHMLVGVGEGLATALIALAVLRARPSLLAGASPRERGRAGLVAYGLLLALGLAVFVAPFACPWPDGLETVAGRLGFASHAALPLVRAPASDYRLPFVGSLTLATALAGALGTVLAFLAAYLLARWVTPRAAENPRPAGDESPARPYSNERSR